MFKDNVKFNGYFKIQSIDSNGTILDEWEDDNLIMETARETMSEIFANLGTNTFIERISIGTEGHVGTDIIDPKDASEGFVKERDRLFSEVYPGTINTGDVLPDARLNDDFYIEPDTTTNGYYRYIGVTTTDYTVLDADLINPVIWTFIGATEPYVYNVTFEIPGTSVDGVNGDPVNNLVEDDVGSGSTINVLQSDTSVTFFVDIGTGAGNSQDGGTTSIFTEAALYANGRIFSMKTFNAKVKDNSVLLRVQWIITF